MLSLHLRQRCAVWLDRQAWLPSGKWWAIRLIEDMAHADPDAYHRFLWTHHLAYAETYEVERRFGADRLHRTRHMLFEDVERTLAREGLSFARDIGSAFEVGCSLGYLLRHLETTILARPGSLAGVDIDRSAIEAGRRYLGAAGSRVELHAADMDELEAVLGDRRYDLFLCCGVLMYTGTERALRIVRTMLDRADKLVAISGLADPQNDNAELRGAEVRERDGTFIHNIDALVQEAGGEILFRRWEGARVIEGNTVYFVLCRKLRAARVA